MWDEDGIDVFGYRHIWGYAARELELCPLVLQPFDKFLLIKYYSEAQETHDQSGDVPPGRACIWLNKISHGGL